MEMYNDSNYQELRDYYSKTTIFNVLGIERNENRHSSFLCWLFDGDSSHGLGDEPMKKLLRLYASKMGDGVNDNLKIMLMAGNYDLRISEILTEKSIKKVITKDTSGRIDIWAKMTLVNKEEENDIPIVLIVENKIYSSEGENQTKYYHEYFEKTKEPNEIPIEIYLTPEPATSKKAPSCESFINIIYPELLKHAILPLSRMTMPTEAAQIVSDYIRNLSKPSKDKGGYTVIATSEDEKKKLEDLYGKFPELYQVALIAGNMEQIIKYGKKDHFNNIVEFLCKHDLINVSGDKYTTTQAKEYIQGMKHLQLLEAFWNNNEDLFKAILPQIKNKMDIHIDSDRVFKISHRDNSRYDVYTIENDKKKYFGKRLFKNRAANAIFRAYIESKPKITIEELRRKFSGEINYYHNKGFEHLFYEAATTNPVFDKGDNGGKLGNIDWDFLYKEEFLLPIENGTKKVMSVKVWRKPDFERLLQTLKNTQDLQFIKVELFSE